MKNLKKWKLKFFAVEMPNLDKIFSLDVYVTKKILDTFLLT